MKYLFDTRGRHVANLVNNQLHAPTGQNIGHRMQEGAFFIDMRGCYLGEIIYENRLVRRRSSPYGSTNFGSYGNYGNVGNYGNPGNHGSIGSIAGFEDIPAELLKP